MSEYACGAIRPAVRKVTLSHHLQYSLGMFLLSQTSPLHQRRVLLLNASRVQNGRKEAGSSVVLAECLTPQLETFVMHRLCLFQL